MNIPGKWVVDEIASRPASRLLGNPFEVRPRMYEKLKLAIDSGLFSAGLTEVVPPPTSDEIVAKANQLPVPLRPEHVQLLLEWGGSNLDEIRINGLHQVICNGALVEFANDYNGFIYRYDQTGAVFSEDTDGGLIEEVASSIPEFINEVFLGERCVPFYGVDWLEELRKHKLV